MNRTEIASALYEMASDMDFADYMDTKEETIDSIAGELKNCPVLKQILEIVVSERE